MSEAGERTSGEGTRGDKAVYPDQGSYDCFAVGIAGRIGRHEKYGSFAARQDVAHYHRAHHPDCSADVRALQAEPARVFTIRRGEPRQLVNGTGHFVVE